MYAQPEHDNDDDIRARAAFVQHDRILCDRLVAATKPATFERAFLLRDPATFDPADRQLLRRLAWFYRNRLPAWLRPSKNPDDPIVRESTLRHG